MTTIQERAQGLALWAKDSPSDEVADKLAELERASLNWHVAMLVLPRDQLERIEHMATHLIANGYEPPAV